MGFAADGASCFRRRSILSENRRSGRTMSGHYAYQRENA